MALDFGAGCIGGFMVRCFASTTGSIFRGVEHRDVDSMQQQDIPEDVPLGIAGVLAGHPLDTIKVKLQTQDVKNPIYRGTWHTFTTILRTESVKGLYKGVTSPMGGVAFINAILFGLYGNIQRSVAKNEDDITSHIAAGAIAGFAQSFISGPMEMAKIRLQVQKTQVYRSAIDCLMKSAKDGGIKEVYRGMTLTVMREVPSFSAYFFTYEALMKHGKGTTLEMLFAGGMAGVASWFITYPIDVIKTRIQSDGIRGEKLKYRGTLHCVQCAIAEEGYRFLFRGLNSTLIRAFPTNSVTFTVVTWIFKLSQRLEEGYVTPTMPEPPKKPEDPGNQSQPVNQNTSHSIKHKKPLHVHDHDRIHLHNADFSFYSII